MKLLNINKKSITFIFDSESFISSIAIIKLLPYFIPCKRPASEKVHFLIFSKYRKSRLNINAGTSLVTPPSSARNCVTSVAVASKVSCVMLVVISL